jgi:hypothetical protein
LYLTQHRVDVDAPMPRREWPEPPRRLLELPLGAGAPPATRLVPGDDDVHEALEEVLLLGVGRAPRVLEGLVRGEVLAGPCQLEALLEISRERP